MRSILLAPVAAAILLAGCASQGEPPSAQRLTGLVSHGVQLDYTPLASPRAAVAEGDLVVRGTLTDVVDGPTVKYPDASETERMAGQYATFVLRVDEVISGDASKVRDGRVHVTVDKSPTTGIGELAQANSRPQVVAVLDDAGGWKPEPRATVTRPTEAPLFFAYTDGLWLQDAGAPEMTGVHAQPSDLSTAWNAPRTVAQVAAALRNARG